MDEECYQQFLVQADMELPDHDLNPEMAGPDPPKFTKEGGKPIESAAVADMTKQLLDDLLYNIIHDTVSQVHREEKIARMESATIAAKQEADKSIAEEEAKTSPTKINGFVKPPAVGSEASIKLETPAATYDSGKVYLKGNPFKTQKEIICPNCHLPRLLYPTSGVGARPVPDPEREYCKNQPPIRKAGCDVHGNPFVTDKPSYKGKKKQQTTTSTPATSGPSSPTPSGNGAGLNSSMPAEKTTFPYAKCPNNCERYLIITRMAHHLDGCMGLSGRQSSRNAMAKITGTNTPKDSRASTPKPTGKRARADGESDDGTVKKKKKTVLQKKASSSALGKKPLAKVPPSKLKNGITQEDTMSIFDESDSVAVGDKAD